MCQIKIVEQKIRKQKAIFEIKKVMSSQKKFSSQHYRFWRVRSEQQQGPFPLSPLNDLTKSNPDNDRAQNFSSFATSETIPQTKIQTQLRPAFPLSPKTILQNQNKKSTYQHIETPAKRKTTPRPHHLRNNPKTQIQTTNSPQFSLQHQPHAQPTRSRSCSLWIPCTRFSPHL